MQGSYTVALASPHHVPLLPEIERKAAALFGGLVPAELLEHVTPEPVFLAAQQEGMLWVALGPDDEPVGFVRVVTAGSRIHLAELDVLPAHGRRGVGTALIRAVEEWAGINGCSEITLTTYRDVPWNAPFYARVGFTVVPGTDWDDDLRERFEQEACLDSERARRVIMRKRLGAGE
jgi:GNAT superfamily N-acetyltransferase